MKLVTSAGMRTIEQAAFESGAATGLELMERAGRGVVDAILHKWPRMAASPGKAIVLCGPGNNGGDGFVIARLLAAKAWQVDVYLYGDATRLPADAATNLMRWQACGTVSPWTGLGQDTVRDDSVDIIVDALFGIGLSRALPEMVGAVAGWIGHADLDGAGDLSQRTAARLVAVDVPSGLCADSGRPIGNAPLFKADLTVTFGYPKPGHFAGKGPALCGSLVVADIGVKPGGLLSDLAVLDQEELAGDLNWVARREGAHKFDHGHVLVVSGGVGKGGAARLAARGALRIGAGLVTIGAPPAAIIENAAHLNAVMLQRIANAEDLSTCLEDTRINAVVLGPGMGVGARTREMVWSALESGRAIVLDADALTSFRDMPDDLFAMTAGARAVLTPHGGEFARLFPDLAAKLTTPPSHAPFFSAVDAARAASARAGCVVLLKGAATVIADPDGACAISAAAYGRAAPWLGTAGSGDVLAGFIGGLLARGRSPSGAARLAAFLHQDCALAFGPGLIAEDLPEQLPQVLRRFVT